MRIVVLQGMPNNGKTLTLNEVWNVLCNTGGGNSTNRQTLGGDPNDFSDIVIRGQQRIAFYTMGDYSTPLANAIYDYDRQGCDVMVCALSTNSPKIRANNALNHFGATRINKTPAPNAATEQTVNAADAQTIYNLI